MNIECQCLFIRDNAKTTITDSHKDERTFTSPVFLQSSHVTAERRLEKYINATEVVLSVDVQET